MQESRSLEVYKGLRDAQQKLDYFLLGLSSALFAYIGSDYKPEPISFSQNTAELISICLLFISILASFKRIDLNISIMRLNFQQLDMSEKQNSIQQALSFPGNILNLKTGGSLDRNEAAKILKLIKNQKLKVEKKLNKCMSYFSATCSIRNWSLILGFITLCCSKLIGVYIVSTNV